jgi:hypothetical protein
MAKVQLYHAGPVVSINLAGKLVVLLGTPKVAADLFGGYLTYLGSTRH